MVKLDFEEYDEISKMELIIESIIRNFRLEQVLISLANDEKQKIMILTILSILCKQKYYQEYLKKHVIQYQQDGVIQVIEEVINKLKESLETNDIKEATYKLKEHGEFIQINLDMYFQKKHANYITEKHSMKLVIDQNKQKELLETNPYTINQLLKYLQKPLTQEETIIEEMIEFQQESFQTYKIETKILKYIKALMKKNYNEEQLNNTIAFILSNVYQEVLEDYNDQNRRLIKNIVENEDLNKTELIEHFKNNDMFSNMILKKFLIYNDKIEEGRLEELQHKESKKYAKRLYDK